MTKDDERLAHEAELARLIADYYRREIGRLMHQAEHWRQNGKPLAVHDRVRHADAYFQIVVLMERDPAKGWQRPFDAMREAVAHTATPHEDGAYPASAEISAYRDPRHAVAQLAAAERAKQIGPATSDPNPALAAFLREGAREMRERADKIGADATEIGGDDRSAGTDADAGRLADLLRRRADVYAPARQRPSYYGDDDIDLLRRLLDEREADIAKLRRLNEISRDNLRSLWAALRQVRETVETLGPVGAVKAEEQIGPEPSEEAEALVAGIERIARLQAERVSSGSAMEMASDTAAITYPNRESQHHKALAGTIATALTAAAQSARLTALEDASAEAVEQEWPTPMAKVAAREIRKRIRALLTPKASADTGGDSDR